MKSGNRRYLAMFGLTNVVEIRKLREREAHTQQVSDEGTYVWFVSFLFLALFRDTSTTLHLAQ